MLLGPLEQIDNIVVATSLDFYMIDLDLDLLQLSHLYFSCVELLSVDLHMDRRAKLLQCSDKQRRLNGHHPNADTLMGSDMH